jgi:uncharacterized surface protein with fasciclin (FAS1) repeats
VFAPTNAAFQSLLQTLGLTKEELLASPILPGVLKYHVVPGVAAKVCVTFKAQLHAIEDVVVHFFRLG